MPKTEVYAGVHCKLTAADFKYISWKSRIFYFQRSFKNSNKIKFLAASNYKYIFPSLHEDSLEITHTVPLMIITLTVPLMIEFSRVQKGPMSLVGSVLAGKQGKLTK